MSVACDGLSDLPRARHPAGFDPTSAAPAGEHIDSAQMSPSAEPEPDSLYAHETREEDVPWWQRYVEESDNLDI
ncbi:unnamed protein product [Angiostrongylus costaricensis]|uniref:Uncharacterized protein n=1 Tax=Angiostrongylus costaricensis TaxID=334426 RepID=A0A0R3PKL1_ANGCS|nr:unnamed protein product [Angiostrongylus costaricensis]